MTNMRSRYVPVRSLIRLDDIVGDFFHVERFDEEHSVFFIQDHRDYRVKLVLINDDAVVEVSNNSNFI